MKISTLTHTHQKKKKFKERIKHQQISTNKKKETE